MILDLQPDDVSRIDRVVPPVGDRRDRKSRQKPFPEITEKGNPKPADESPPETTEPDLVPATSDVAGPTPSEAERARLLDRVIDDPTRGFRSGRDRNKFRRPSGLAW